ncbi:hypothetical protein PHYBOEH_006905 [Phytophthora boehmeriae]|uniref:START domain-containing protein n=1 Tax=Phytophthora boehmeriae TaxID=109152 RepID=A0A8T1WB41_9STRA|nr:hypothetical protein PHYBOEH_006905 [Phytophthora boehmeriae]
MRTASVIATQSGGLYSNLFVQPNDELRYAMYIHELDGAYAQTDAILSSCGMGPTEDEVAFQRVVTSHGEIEYGWKKVFPFSYKQTCDSFWMLSYLVHQQEEREEFYDVENPENTAAIKLRFTKMLPGVGRESLVHRFVHRRFREKDRAVYVWKSSILGDGSFRGMQMDETGWRVIRPSETGDGTFVKVCIRQTPLHLGSSNAAIALVARQFDDFVQAMVQVNCEEMNIATESLLLEDALKGVKVRDVYNRKSPDDYC